MIMLCSHPPPHSHSHMHTPQVDKCHLLPQPKPVQTEGGEGEGEGERSIPNKMANQWMSARDLMKVCAHTYTCEIAECRGGESCRPTIQNRSSDAVTQGCSPPPLPDFMALASP